MIRAGAASVFGWTFSENRTREAIERPTAGIDKAVRA
jgi:hypothetical protein